MKQKLKKVSYRATVHGLVRVGMSDRAILNRLKKIGLPDGKEWYVGWYRAELARLDAGKASAASTRGLRRAPKTGRKARRVN